MLSHEKRASFVSLVFVLLCVVVCLPTRNRGRRGNSASGIESSCSGTRRFALTFSYHIMPPVLLEAMGEGPVTILCGEEWRIREKFQFAKKASDRFRTCNSSSFLAVKRTLHMLLPVEKCHHDGMSLAHARILHEHLGVGGGVPDRHGDLQPPPLSLSSISCVR